MVEKGCFMANEIEKTGALKFKDEAGNVYILYPVTTAEQVEGLEEKVNTLAAEQVGKTEPKSHSHAYSDITGKPSAFPPESHSHAYSEITDKPSTFTPAAHNQAASTITAGTFAATGIMAAAGTDYTTARIRNSYANTTEMTAKSTPLTSGNIYLQYE